MNNLKTEQIDWKYIQENLPTAKNKEDLA